MLYESVARLRESVFFLAERLTFGFNFCMKEYLLYVVAAVCCAGGNSLFAADSKKTDVENPYGVCAHLSRSEFDIAPDEIRLMREAGIGGFRTDFDWSAVENKNGELDFSRWDKLVEYSKEGGVEVLPIISGSVPARMRPFPHHPDEFAEAYGKAVARYKGKIK